MRETSIVGYRQTWSGNFRVGPSVGIWSSPMMMMIGVGSGGAVGWYLPSVHSDRYRPVSSSPTGASFDAPFWRNRRRCRRRRSCLLDVATAADGGADAAAADDCCCRGCSVVVVGYPKPREPNRYHAPRFFLRLYDLCVCIFIYVFLDVFVSCWCVDFLPT